MNNNEKKYLLICNTSDGLVAQLNGVIVQLQLARRLNLEPIIYLHKRSYMFGGPNPYFDRDLGPNVWEYFYEPVGATQEALQSLVKSGKVYTLSTASELIRLFRWDPKSWFMNPFGYFRSVENRSDGDYPFDWWYSQRERARVFLQDGTVRFKARIHDQIDRFADQNFTESMLGLQLRGSDKFDFGVGPNLSRKVLPEEYFPHIDKYLAEHPKCTRIFVATDQRQWLEILRKAYPGKIVSYSEKSLSDSDANRFHDASEKSARGVEVLVDVLLLSRCNFVLKCHSAVGEMALVLNPDLEFLDLNYATQPFQVKNRAFRAIFAPSIQFLCFIWKILGERGLALAKVTSVEDDRIMVGGTHPRDLNVKDDATEKAPRPPLFSYRFLSDAFNWLSQALANLCFAYNKR